ncbi:MAG TPA: CoA transferase [Acidimicrobiales bacterium]|nr:CoA transferase [Acidimicrobiales bacterium]
MPLAGRRFVVAGAGPVADEAAALLDVLDAVVVRVPRVTPGLATAGAEGALDATATLAAAEPPYPVVDVAGHFDAAESWARSGAMALTGLAEGPPLPCPSAVLAARVVAAGSVIQLLAATTFGSTLALDPMALLGERAALTGHTRRGSVAVGGACEMLRAADGWIALNLARADDVALLPAWLDGDIDDPSDGAGTARAVGRRATSELVARGAELGLALASWPPAADPVSSPYVIDGWREGAARLRPIGADRGDPPESGHDRDRAVQPLVVDLSSLWAGPLASELMAQAGARVVKVEGARRADGARRGTAQFFDLLNVHKRCIVVDFDDEDDISVLRALIERASLVIEGSRPRVMDRIGIDPADVVARGTSWLSITAYGRDGVYRNRVGFGDDVAVSAGLVIAGEPPLFVADAVADPIAGLFSAAAGLACLGATRGHLVDASLYRATRYAHGSQPASPSASPVAASSPRARPARGGAEAVGASTDEVLAELVPDLWRSRRAKMRGPRSG